MTTVGPLRNSSRAPRNAFQNCAGVVSFPSGRRFFARLAQRGYAVAIQDVRGRGFETATLWVLESNELARRFFEIAGWRPDGTEASERVDGEMRSTVRYRVEL